METLKKHEVVLNANDDFVAAATSKHREFEEKFPKRFYHPRWQLERESDIRTLCLYYLELP